MVCEISQPKIAPYEKGLPLRNYFATKRDPLRNWAFVAKTTILCEIISQPHTPPPSAKIFAAAKHPLSTRVPFHSPQPHFASTKWPVKLAAKIPLGCENGLWLRNHLWTSKWLRNHLQTMKWPPGCEIDLWNGGGGGGLRKHLAKPREVVKMPTEPCEHASKEESHAHHGITHTKPLTPFLTSLNPSEPIAPAESSNWGDFAT